MWAAETSECSAAWMIDNHYCDESCGRCSGGGDGSGGSSTGTGGTGGIPSTCTQPNSQECSTYKVGQHCGLTYEIWTDSSAGCMTNTANGFLAEWTAGNGNYLARKGVRPGSSSPVVTYSADYNPNGNSYLAIYGWTQNPLVEYYIVDSWGSWRPPGTSVIGTVQVDGGTYEIYRSERVNQPSIEGTKTFWQYWSVRTSKRTSGTITVAPHFAAWEQFGLQMGSFYEVSLVVEGYHSSGSADVTVSFQ
jgi:endo-1,4-beta-xylanase